MNRQSKRILGLFARYVALLIMGLGNLYIFYKILTPITIKSAGAILTFFSGVRIAGSFIVFKGIIAEIAPSCIAAAAFYLLFILIFSTAEVKPMKRFLALVASFTTLFILNISRIVFLVLIIDRPYFSTVHWIFWQLLSTIFVVAIWIGMIFLLKIKTIPVYSDFKYIYGLARSERLSKKRGFWGRKGSGGMQIAK